MARKRTLRETRETRRSADRAEADADAETVQHDATDDARHRRSRRRHRTDDTSDSPDRAADTEPQSQALPVEATPPEEPSQTRAFGSEPVPVTLDWSFPNTLQEAVDNAVARAITDCSATATSAWGRISTSARSAHVKNLARYAIAAMATSTPIVRKDDAAKRVLDEHARAFPICLAGAQALLRGVFGLELKAAGAASSGRYFLRNGLSPAVSARVVRWGNDLGQKRALVCVILALVHASGGTVDADAMTRFLTRLRLRARPSAALTPTLTHPVFGSSDALLAMLERLGYLQRVRQRRAGSEAVAQRSGDAQYLYQWGARARVEFSDEHIVRFLSSVMDRDDQQFKRDLVRLFPRDESVE